MNIDKAIRKQNKSLKRFLFSSCFIFLLIIILLIFIPQMFISIKIVLVASTMIILVTTTNRIEENYLKYSAQKDKIYIKTGILDPTTIIRSNKVVLVHTQNINKDMEIIIVAVCKTKRRNFKPVNNGIFKNNSKLYNHFESLKNKHKQSKFFYTVINSGGYNKYKLLNDIFVNCEDAFFSDEAIDNIKLYRNVE